MNSVTPACEPLVFNVGLISKDEMLQKALTSGFFSPGVPECYYFFRIFFGPPSVRVVKVKIITKSQQFLAAEGIDVAIRQHRTQVCKASRVRFFEVRAKTVHTNCPDGRWHRKVGHGLQDLENLPISLSVFAWETVQEIPLGLNSILLTPFQKLNIL